HVVAGVLERRRHDRHQPDSVNAEFLEISQPGGETAKIAEAIMIGVLEGAHVHFIEYGVPIPLRSGQQVGISSNVLMLPTGARNEGECAAKGIENGASEAPIEHCVEPPPRAASAPRISRGIRRTSRASPA